MDKYGKLSTHKGKIHQNKTKMTALLLDNCVDNVDCNLAVILRLCKPALFDKGKVI